jgi:hypothetical protein
MSGQPLYNLGKIVNKHIILEVFSYAETLPKSMELLHYSNRKLKKILSDNFKLAMTILGKIKEISDRGMLLNKKFI